MAAAPFELAPLPRIRLEPAKVQECSACRTSGATAPNPPPRAAGDKSGRPAIPAQSKYFCFLFATRLSSVNNPIAQLVLLGLHLPNPLGAAPMSSKICLIVDDEPSIRTFLKAILQGEGFQTLEAESAPEAYRMLQNLDGDVDLVVTDIVMSG